MSFVDHLEELRWHLIRSAIALFTFTIIVFLSKELIFDTLIFGPTKSSFPTYVGLCQLSSALGLGDLLCLGDYSFIFINTEMAGQFLVHLKVSLVLGFVLTFPYLFWELWRFIKPGLYQKEITYTRGIVFFSSLLFFTGVSFGYFILTPFAINFFGTYSVTDIVNNTFTLTNYTGFLTMFVLASGILFELPMVVYFLSKLGLLTPKIMKTYRKHAFVGIVIVAAVITPADVGTQLLVTVPVYVLYEFSIFISANVERKRLKDNL
ncbi:MAG: twin-arginine translocase subunit TatC [Chitinophagaceae bacterium]|nr:MAG: twin-arginine translocase subunit TatC [Chitinophagaceae bacterium]